MHLFSTLAGTARSKMWLVHHIVVWELQPRCPFCRESVILNFFCDCQWDPSTNWAGSQFMPHPWLNTTFFSFLTLILRLCIQECEEYSLTLGFQQQSETKCHIVLASKANAEEVIRIQSNVNHRTVNACKKIHPFTKFYNYDIYMVTKLKPKRLFMENKWY